MKKIIVVAGASSGFGRMAAQELAKLGIRSTPESEKPRGAMPAGCYDSRLRGGEPRGPARH
jgi:NAD(P)-dependent dehydrogenase (short-subunit alcohol dehydrogenase family)